MRRLLIILALCCGSLFAQTITGVAVNATGFDIGVTISGFTDLGTVAMGLNAGNGPTSGCVTTNATTVTLVACPNGSAGTTFTTGGAWTGSGIAINGVLYQISSVGSSTSLTLTGSAGIQSTPVAYTQATVMLAVTRPTDYGGSVGTVTDIVYGTSWMRVTYPTAWAATTAHSLNDQVADATTHCASSSKPCVQKVIACSGTCTTGGSAPSWTTSGGACGSSPPIGCTTVDNSGGNQVTWKNMGTTPQEGATGGPSGPPDENISSGTTVVIRVSLSKSVYSVDTATVIIAPSFYHDNGPGGSGSFSSALARAAVTNNSTVTYATSKPVCRATWPGFERVTADFPVEVLCASGFARNQSEVESIVFTATDQHSNSVSVTSSSMSLSFYNGNWTNSSVPYASGPGDQFPVYVYSAVIPVSTLTQGDQITVTWLAYPWAGDSTSVFNSTVGQDGVAQPSENAGPIYEILDKAGTYGLAFATVKTTGSDSTCTGRVLTTRAAAESDSGLLTMAKAASCIEAYNNTNYSRANTCGGMILMGAKATWTTGAAQFALGTSPCWLVVDKISTLNASQVIFTTQGNNGFPDSDGNTLLKFQNVTIAGSGGLFFGTGSGTDTVWFHNVIYNSTATANVENNGGVIYVTQLASVGPTSGYFYYNGGNKRIAYELVRGVSYPYTTTPERYGAIYTLIGNSGIEPYEVYIGNAASQGGSDNAIVAYSAAYEQDGNAGSGNLTTSGQSLTKGVAWLQSIVEGQIFNLGNVSAQTTNMTVNNFIVHHLITPNGATTLVNARNHIAYEVISNFSNTMNNWDYRWNNFDEANTEHDASPLNVTNPARVGAWPIDYGTGALGNIQLAAGDTGDFFGLGSPAAAQTPAYVNGTHYFGNYRITSTSANIGLDPWTTTFDEVLPFDLSGAPRTCPLGVGCTSGAYMYNVGDSTTRTSAARGSVIR